MATACVVIRVAVLFVEGRCRMGGDGDAWTGHVQTTPTRVAYSRHLGVSPSNGARIHFTYMPRDAVSKVCTMR